MSYFNMVCDVCGREVQGYNIVNGMKFCAKCYQEIFGNKNMTENLNNMYEAYLKILNEKDQRIAELEEQLKNAIVPKFEVGQTLFRIDFGSIVPFLVNEIYGHIKADKTISIQYFDYVGLVIEENELFAIREEAEQKLAEIRGKDE